MGGSFRRKRRKGRDAPDERVREPSPKVFKRALFFFIYPGRRGEVEIQKRNKGNREKTNKEESPKRGLKLRDFGIL